MSHQGAAVIAARLRVGLLPLGGAHVVRDRTTDGAGVGGGRTANHRLCRSRREYGRGNRDDRDDSVRLDLSYVGNWSMLSDLAIAARTVGAVCRGSVHIERAIGTHKEVQMFDNDARKAGLSLRTGSMLA
jgi:hypothetical protein